MKPSKIPNPIKSTMPLFQELNLLKQKQVSRRSKLDLTKTKTPPTAKGKRLKTSTKVAKPAKKKQPEKTSKAKGTDEGTGDKPGVPEYRHIHLMMSKSLGDHEDQDDDNEQTDSDNNGDDFVHPKFSTHDEEDNEEEGSDMRVQTPSHYESTDDEESDEVTHGANVEGEELDEEATNEEDKANELYKDVNVNLEGRDNEMTDALCTIIQTTQVIEDTHMIITPVNPKGQQQSSSVSSGFVSNMLNPTPDTGIDSIFNLNTESTSLVDILVTTITELPISSATTLPPPTIPLITHLQQTPAPTPTKVPSSTLQDLPNFAVSSIPGIVDAYLANKMHEAVKTVVQLQFDRLRDEAQAENADFINKLDDNIKKIIKDQVKEHVKAQVSEILLKVEKTVNEQLKVEVLTRLSNESKTSHAIAANLSKLELKKIPIDKMESNKSIHKSDEHKNLYK
ncbi:hypothetical protein Tco_1494390, partial [Tanacetum coccineum]